MKNMLGSIGLAVVSSFLSSSLMAQEQAQSVKTGYKTPQVTAPYAYQKPSIDGVVNEAEWQGAESINALQTTGKQISSRQARFWMMWDEDTLYMAMRSPLRPGERVVQNLRDTTRDINVVFDDAYEIFVDVGSRSPDGQPVFFQYLANFPGARYDVMHEPAVGNSRLGWTANWTLRNRLTEKNEWEMEVAIPRQSLYRDKPFADQEMLTFLVARDFKKPWEQNSFEGTGDFSARDTHTRVRLSKSAPAIHLLRVADPRTQTFGLELAAYGNEAAKLAWTFDSDAGVSKSGTFDVPKGKLVTAPGMGMDFDKFAVPEKGKSVGAFRIRVTSADGKTTFLDWASARQFANLPALDLEKPDSNDRIGVSLALNPVNDYVRLIGDFIDYDNRAQVDHCEVIVTSEAGKTVAKEIYTLDTNAYIRGVIRLPGLPEGKYSGKLTVFGKGGAVLREVTSEFSKQDPAKKFKWWNTTAGNIEKVIPPWTPMKAKGNVIDVWGRTMTVGAAGLPAQIVSQGRKLLAGPAVLRAEMADGKTLDAKGSAKIASAADHRVVATSGAALGGIEVSSKVTAEFDGMYKVELTLTPKGKAEIKTLKMIVPLDPTLAGYVYGKGDGIRYGFDMGPMPAGASGTIWTSRKVDSQPMLVGSFIPYLWVGSADAGLCWFADSDRGWVPNDKVPAIELVRNAKSVDMVFNLISDTFTLDAPRTIVFAFQASPAKALTGPWRDNRWWCGNTFDWGGGGWVYPDGKGSTIWQSRPNTTNIELCRKKSDEVHKNGGLVVPYFEYNTMSDAGEQGYFGEAWKTSSGPLYYGKSLTDYIIWNLDDWIKSCNIDGWYLDNVRPVFCDNIDAGRGYRLPDGRVQPEFNLFTMREFFLRLRAVFHENGKDSVIVNHMTNNQILPWNAAVDVGYDGEHHVIYPEMGKDFMDFWSLDRLFTIVPGTWGININFMNEYQGQWEKEQKAKAMRAYSGAVIMHDALPTGNSASDASQRALMAARNRFGIASNDVSFIGYWKKDAGPACATKDVYLATWVRPGKVLVGVINWGEKAEADVRLDFTKLGLANPCKAWDAETPETVLAIDADGRMQVPVERHNFRLIVVEKQ